MSIPPKQALIVAHGQPSDPEPPELWLSGFAAKVGLLLPDWDIRSATIAKPEALENQSLSMEEDALVFPMFMADGWFVGRVLPRRLKGRNLRILPPLGFHSALPDLATELIQSHLIAQGWPQADTRLLLAGHGSAKGDKAALSTRNFAEALSERLPEIDIIQGLIEESPFIFDAARDLGPKAICLPFFALEGGHCKEDIPEALDNAGFVGLRLPPLGHANSLPELVASALTQERQ
ncbi:sirohydrochlorin ferrochelatase [Shimia isoporae]|uniref:Sirohydrochlorin ferrochelatase n=1 Tax=Shimia isoporae TaxID=647720 RepID=A0A4R1NYG3_9RHOB|nr:CbiX/SirB N-terminal domain-containing protein [Shimia isoporae]TCL10262.1 sirohydrochlorin ferrochelatase [Shimia isoporae]